MLFHPTLIHPLKILSGNMEIIEKSPSKTIKDVWFAVRLLNNSDHKWNK